MNREKTIEIFKRLKENAPNEMHLETVGSAQELFEMAIQALSQEPKTGHWIEHEKGFWSWVNKNGERDGWIPDYECSECGSRAWKRETNYCPQCGAKMVEPQERSDKE